MKGLYYFKEAQDAINNRISLYNTTSKVSLSGVRSLRHSYPDSEPILEAPATTKNSNSILECERLSTNEKGYLVDHHGRLITLKGINLDSAAKLPATPNMPTYKGDATDTDNVFFDGDNVSFVGRPFSLDEAESHFLRIKSWGYNTIRYIITWEALEHKGPGIYDEEFIDYTTKILEVIHSVGGLYVFIDVHQDVWSRFSGGSGAPMWTLYAAGLQPKRFSQTEAAILHNEPRFHPDDDTDTFPKMIWPTNYRRLASLVMFTMFFSGKNYFPQFKINGQNVQAYLQGCFFKSIKHFWMRVSKSNREMIEDGTLFGFETVNEPNCGLMGNTHLGEIPASQQLRVGTTPTVYQCFKLGMGLPCEVDVYRISLAGPQKYGTQCVDPNGQRAWLTIEEAHAIDARYGWERSPEWIIGECVFQQIGVWSYNEVDFKSLPSMSIEEKMQQNAICELQKPNFFNQFAAKHNFKMYSGVKPTKIDMEFFINNNFVDFVAKFKKTIRSITPDVFFMIQPPVLEIPPNLKTDPRGIVDKKTIYCPHYYDGMSLMFKTWNPRYNVDTLGIMRGRYLNPVLGIVFGERAIRNCMKKQFNEMKKECEDYLGSIPILMSETGMPFDMDDKRAYTNGRYSSQTLALDALSYALEGSAMSHTYWCYNSTNCHKWGDRWNNEDFSFWSAEDRNLSFTSQTSLGDILTSSVSTTASLLKNTRARRINSKVHTLKHKIKGSSEKEEITQIEEIEDDKGSIEAEEFEVSKQNIDDDEDDLRSIQDASLIFWTADNVKYRHSKKCYPSPDGVRAAGAIIRPYVVACCGDLIATEFDMRTVRFSLTVSIQKGDTGSCPTVIYVPKWHYPKLNYHDIYLSSGVVRYNKELEYLEWYHYENEDNSEMSTLVDDTVPKEETIIIKNNSGTLDDINPKDDSQKQGNCIIM
ncbi:hypothetical protein PSN45_003937 [Yamadazyma tenuis]|uniref:Glycoside hydrolase n=1 Tax=Candida tenuis (strain ATCC 10573 / BCRC 21748 / CBS 615 / JCM 9827 / NBRC 10315 / NRRL Y-1498 / VKM Y-70) TaxID=590646 RepID=G3B4M3_CANTC|nr:glycoside hydrolase [Yamadazyma tenuis ATCC 10573]EGV63981.1 glycoside hydrolase [Yamadazyma tenuis ATCC 10573]WEJ96398.1 hypothetical protein PSN45_003937 [Yamadazyma tenuis]